MGIWNGKADGPLDKFFDFNKDGKLNTFERGMEYRFMNETRNQNSQRKQYGDYEDSSSRYHNNEENNGRTYSKNNDKSISNNNKADNNDDKSNSNNNKVDNNDDNYGKQNGGGDSTMKNNKSTSVIKFVILIVAIFGLIYGFKSIYTNIKTCAEPGCNFNKEKGFDYCYRHMKEHGLDYDFSDLENDTTENDETYEEEATRYDIINNTQKPTSNSDTYERETTRKTYNYSNSSKKHYYYDDSYDDGYDDVISDDDYDYDRYDEDDDYADGVDDAIDEMMEEGEGDW